MGWMDSLFGGSKTVDINDDEIKNMARGLYNFDPGLGMAGGLAKHYLKSVRQGKMTDLPSVQLAISQGQRNWTDLQRNLQMNTAMMPGEQQGMTAGLQMEGMLKNQNNTGMGALQGAANDISNFSQIFDMARGQRINAELTGMQAGANILQRGKQRVQTKGIIPGIMEIAGPLLGGLAGGLGSGGGGGGGGNPFSGDPSICWVAEALYGEGDLRVQEIRNFLLNQTSAPYKAFVKLYKRFGERLAKVVKRSKVLQAILLPLFNNFLQKARS